MSLLPESLPEDHAGGRIVVKASPLAIELKEQKAQLIAYLLSKVKSGDWHACADAAMDLREIDAKLELLIDVGQSAVPLTAVQPFDRRGL